MTDVSAPRRPLISVVIVTYDMARELPRTLSTLSPEYQRGISAGDCDIVVVDNGSPVPVGEELIHAHPDIRFVRIDDAPPSPALAANHGLSLARADLVGLIIDGARMASPGLLNRSLQASRISPRPVISTLAWHLGSDLHMNAAASGHDQRAEDELLESVDWFADGYRLFDISTLAASSRRGYFGPLGESNGLFMSPTMWDELGGLEEAFTLPGGGLVNHDLYRRACELSDTDLIVLLGEGTFHQFHGGAFTSGDGDRKAAREEYRSIRGPGFTPLERDTLYFGSIPDSTVPLLDHSTGWRRDQATEN